MLMPPHQDDPRFDLTVAATGPAYSLVGYVIFAVALGIAWTPWATVGAGVLLVLVGMSWSGARQRQREEAAKAHTAPTSGFSREMARHRGPGEP